MVRSCGLFVLPISDMTLVEYCTKKLVDGCDLKRLHPRFDTESIRLLLSLFPNRFLLYNDTVVVYLRLTDESFDSLKRGDLVLTNPKVLLPLFKEEGHNTHVISVVSHSIRDMLFLGNYLCDKSLSWIRPDGSKLVVFERS